MGWPKGKPRKPKPEPEPEPEVEPVIHGATSTAITEPCPNCLYAYADGGYCPDCGWMLPFDVDPYGTNSGGKL